MHWVEGVATGSLGAALLAVPVDLEMRFRALTAHPTIANPMTNARLAPDPDLRSSHGPYSSATATWLRAVAPGM